MERRRYLAALGGSVATLVGGTAAANATRVDITLDGRLHRADGDPAATTKTVTDSAVEYDPDSGRVRTDHGTEPFDAWARRTAIEHAAETVLSVVDRRLDEDLSGVGRGIRSLLFGLVVTVDHTVTRNRDGEVVGEPTVPMEQLLATAPRTMRATVELDGRSLERPVPVGVGHSETQYL
ncbi:hypothetical protein ACFQL1_03465 [Halomicroarcula sp. GCM10025709]|uniref:hypothetical protein n=1 Tax=Haloarcula TaxID=2237 RepID=UPI0024C38144|nr:hypothetical protein [Halomicroarcula sp. YJ-61-S]